MSKNFFISGQFCYFTPSGRRAYVCGLRAFTKQKPTYVRAALVGREMSTGKGPREMEMGSRGGWGGGEGRDGETGCGEGELERGGKHWLVDVDVDVG